MSATLALPAMEAPRKKWVLPSVIPGFGLTLGFTLFYLGALVLIPLGGLLLKSTTLGPQEFAALAFDPRTIGALKLSFGAALIAALINVIFGVAVAWVLVRYDFAGKRLVDAAVDLPFALPTAVAGIALAALYGPNGFIGSALASINLKIAYTPLGVVVALIFVGLPFVVRTVQPVLAEIDKETEEVAATLGAGRRATVSRVILPGLAPAILTGFALALARGIGEYGSVIFIAGNLPYVSEIAPLLIVIKLEEFNYSAATAVAVLMLAISFLMLLAINLIQAWSRQRYGHA